MCGISIVISKINAMPPPWVVREMNNKVVHRGPDDEGYFSKDSFSFGHRRLSIIDTSSAGHQPMLRGNDCIVYNGMLYNYIELRSELIKAGYSFFSQTDTEVILAAYQYWGVKAFAKFNGMWAFAIYDSAEQSIVLCRDHFGIKPLHYTEAGDFFVAGSEIKQFTALPEFKSVINKNAAVNFLSTGKSNYSKDTFFANVYSLDPGHYLKYQLGTNQKQIIEWYNLKNTIVPINATSDEATQQVKYLFESSVKMRMRSDVAVGSCLSGGLDSSSIVSTIFEQQLANNYFKTFTSCYSDKRYDEQEYSDIVTQKTGYDAVKVFPDLNQLFTEGHLDAMLYHQDQPFSSASHYSEFNVFKAARQQNMKVMLDGQGSDEYLCGYPEFFSARINELLRAGNFSTAWQNIQEKGKQGVGSFGLIKELIKGLYVYPLLRWAKGSTGRSEFPWLNIPYAKVASEMLAPDLQKNVKDLSIEQVCVSSIPYQLHSEDRNSMMFSIESRLPFLDHRLVEYIIGLASHHKISNGYSKYVLRKAVTALPEEIKWRKTKLGFAAPDKEWIFQNHAQIRNELKDAVEKTDFFSGELINRFDRVINGELGFDNSYFRAMTFNRFFKIFNMNLS